MSEGAAPVAAILLAAGLSTRMGRTKALLPWDGRPLLAYQIAQLRAAGVEDIVVVTGHDAARIARVAREAGARTAHNAAYREGRAGSLRTGATALAKGVRAIVVLSVDQPRPATLIRSVLAAHLGAHPPITVPVQGGRRGHPPVLDGELLTELRTVTEEEQGLRAVMRRHQDGILFHNVNDTRCLIDINTPESYQQALGQFGISPAVSQGT